MQNNKVVISFDPDNMPDADTVFDIWNYWEFRELIKQLVTKTDNIILYLISSSTETDYINSIKIQLGLDSQFVFSVVDDAAKVTKINTLGVDIHFDGYAVSTNTINSQTTCKGINVDYSRVTRDRESMWMSKFQFEYNQLVKSIGGKIEVFE